MRKLWSSANMHRGRRALYAMLVPLALSGGCCLPDAIRSTLQPYQASKFRSSIERRSTREAKRIWEEQYAGQYANQACATDMREGFLAGFVETAFGSGDCPPPIPNRRKGLRPMIGQCMGHNEYPAASPWYNGYHLGHTIALANGVDQWRIAPLNPGIVQCTASCNAAPTVDMELGNDFQYVPESHDSTPAVLPDEVVDTPNVSAEELPVPDVQEGAGEFPRVDDAGLGEVELETLQ